MKKLFTTIVVSIFLALPVFAQLTGKINVVGVPDRYKSSNNGQATTGLKSVGVGQRVVLAGRVFGGGGGVNYNDAIVTINNATWAITSKPAGSNAVLADTGTIVPSKIMYFVPDVAGSYTITMNAVSVQGTALPATLTVTATKFVGAGISALSTNGVPNKCLPCHQGAMAQEFKDITSTNHAQSVKRKLNETGGHFGTSCMSCHAIGYDGVTTTGNDGWDDLAAAAGATYLKWFPSIRPNGPGTYDSLVANNTNLMARAGIQCENCHGAAGEHAATGDKTKIDVSLSSSVCAPCHFSSDRHGIGYQWQASGHAVAVSGGSTTSPQGENRAICTRCHSGQGYINEVINGLPEPVVTGSTMVYADGVPIGCQICHDPHGNNNPGLKDPVTGAYSYPQLRAKTIGDACTGCHETRLSSHSSHQGTMLMGTQATHFTMEKAEAYRNYGSVKTTPYIVTVKTATANQVGPWSGWELPGYTYQNSSHSNMPDRCVTCHMAKSPSYIANAAAGFAKGDSLMTKLGMHTFKVATTLSNGTTYINPTGCMECHGTATIEFVEKTQAKTNAMLAALYAVLPKRDTIVNTSSGSFNLSGAPITFNDTTTWMGSAANIPKTAVKRALTTVERAAAYNFWFVKNDLSFGVHNFMYAKGLLETSIEQLKLGAGASTIVQIKDVPVDNGGNVQIVWNKFPAETYAFGKLTSYSVWRRDPLMPSLGKYINPLNSFSEMMKIATVGGQYTMGASVWTFVATVPVSGQSQYAFIAPTLFDSTKSGGQKYSAFYIGGSTSDGTNTFYASPIDSGYSTNNLFPSMVAGVTAGSSSKGVTLSWTRSTNPVDNDLEKYVIYRGTTAGFTPNPASPYATAKDVSYLDGGVTTGSTYYYKIGAVDKAGNAGPYSTEISLKVTSVQLLSGLPTEFALDQNYPNPFNPSTQIKFALPNESKVSLNIYSVSGELIRTLVNADMAAGFYAVTWNGLNNTGQSVSTGVYLFRVQAGSYVSSKKMMLVK